VNTIDYIYKIQFPQDTSHREEGISFEYGPGDAVVMFLAAYKHFDNEKYL